MLESVLINVILDQSGSMQTVREATCEGFNTFIREQRAIPGEARVTLTLFSNSAERRFTGENINSVPDLGSASNQYTPAGGTALLDAVGRTIKDSEVWIQQQSNFKGRVVTAIITDGQENSSSEYHLDPAASNPNDDKDVAGLIKYKQNEGWEFVFLGASGSDWLEKSFGQVVDSNRILQYTNNARQTGQVYAGLNQSIADVRTSSAAFAMAPIQGEEEGGKTSTAGA